jgi:hypothetical protein
MSDEGRRLSDHVARWSTAAASVLATALLAVIVAFYGDMPHEIRSLSESVAVMRSEQVQMKSDLRDLGDAMRVNQGWRERLVAAEQRIDRGNDRLADHEKRLDKLEQPISLFGSGKKK